MPLCGPDVNSGNGNNPETQFNGFPTAFSWGYRVAARADYNNAFGTAFTVSPRVAFNHDVNGTTPGPGGNFIDGREEITIDYAEGELIDVTQHDGNVIRLRKLAASYSPHDRVAAMNYLHERSAKGEVVTGLLYVDEDAHDLHGHLNTATVPLNRLASNDLSPGAATLAKINASLR